MGRKLRYLNMKQKVLAIAALGLLVTFFVFVIEQNRLHVISKELRRKYGKESSVRHWMVQKYTACNGSFLGFGHQFAVLRNVTLQPNSSKFYIPCDDKRKLDYSFDYGKEGTHLNTWMNNVEIYSRQQYSNSVQKNEVQSVIHQTVNGVLSDIDLKDKVVVAVQRYESANLYHTMTDWYNVFLVATLLDIPLKNVSVLLSGGYTKGLLEHTWKSLFTTVFYTDSLSHPLKLPTLVWSVLGYESPINHHGLENMPFLNEFVRFFLGQHSITSTKSLNCDKIVIVFIWRRDYVAHKGNPSGLISRKIKNEQELLDYFRKRNPHAEVSGIQLDLLSFKEQLQVISNADVLISMHGAGLTHTLFLPPHAGVIELFTLTWTKYFGLDHFRTMARWKDLQYQAWQNLNPTNKFPGHYTYVPPSSLYQLYAGIISKMCP
ncbi:uncharacterized protein LOC128240371 [Mya arenaria]|uniref:uncharacterized protein LOC128240371 n=1 Tax=Mya arenaria TaxID=6604 RepID=UPI0022E25731|nr:uncharacterized protein LOC128240371 [Mya arenaria]XP_052812961.1 uncharacterized protein LOC128240371 [Mya arenaria]XP_052812962.1 uncharacterized protein LOC128240371 [Mya arenaria]